MNESVAEMKFYFHLTLFYLLSFFSEIMIDDFALQIEIKVCLYLHSYDILMKLFLFI